MFRGDSQAAAKAAVFTGVVAVSFAAVFVRLSDATSMITAMYRLLFAAAMTLIVIIFKRQGFQKISPGDGILAVVAGFFLALHFYSWFTSLELTTVASSTVLVTMQPLFIFIGAYLFLKERVALAQLLATLIALAGSVIITLGDRQTGHALAGDALALLGALLVAIYLLVGRRLRAKIPVLEYTFIVYLASGLLLAALALVTGTPFYPYPPKTWVVFLLLALVPTMLGHSLFNWALKYLETSYISVSILGEPVGAALLAYLFFREKPGIFEITGGLLILLGLYLFTKKSMNHNNRT